MILKDEDLVARAKAGDHAALEELCQRYLTKAHEIAFHMTSGNNEEAEEITQEAFLKAIRSLKNFREEAAFSTWLYRIVVNTCLDAIRRRRRWERVSFLWRSDENGKEESIEPCEKEPDTRSQSNPLSVITDTELRRDLKKALRSLPEKQRLAFQLKVFNDMSIREIAQVMKSSEGTIKSHLFRATQFLRQALREWALP